MEIKNITKKYTKENINTILDVYKESFQDKIFWTKKHFLQSLPLKWKLSNAIIDWDFIYGMLYSSKYGLDSAHIHMIFIHPIAQGIGFGRMLIETLALRCKKYNIKYLTVELERKEGRLYEFYEKAGFNEMNIIDLKKYLKLKNRKLTDYLPVNKTENYVLRRIIDIKSDEK